MKRSAQTVYNIFDFEDVPAAAGVVKRVATKLNVGTIPMYEREDLFPSNASGLNKALEYEYQPKFLNVDEHHRFDEATVRYQIAAGSYMGGRLIRETDLPPFKWVKTQSKHAHRVPEDHYLNVRSEAPQGLHSLNPSVKASTNHQKVLSTGFHNRMRADGFERDDNNKIFPRLPTGLPMAVDPQRATIDAERINTTMVEPISVFPSIGF